MTDSMTSRLTDEVLREANEAWRQGYDAYIAPLPINPTSEYWQARASAGYAAMRAVLVAALGPLVEPKTLSRFLYHRDYCEVMGARNPIPWRDGDTEDCTCGLGQALAAAPLVSPPGERTPPTFDMRAHLQRQREFSERTFGPGARTAGVVDHIRKELREIESDPADVSEWIDVVILALDGAWRAGYSPEQIIAALVAKQDKNEARAWPDWRTAPADKAIEHTRVDAPPSAPPPAETRRLGDCGQRYGQVECTRAAGHEGAHIARDNDGNEIGKWSDCCWHGHTTRQVGCVSCVLVFDKPKQGAAEAPAETPGPECWCGRDEALARGDRSGARYDIVCPKHDGDAGTVQVHAPAKE